MSSKILFSCSVPSILVSTKVTICDVSGWTVWNNWNPRKVPSNHQMSTLGMGVLWDNFHKIKFFGGGGGGGEVGWEGCETTSTGSQVYGEEVLQDNIHINGIGVGCGSRDIKD